MSLPVRGGGARVGALNAYSTAPGSSDPAVRRAEGLAACVSALLGGSGRAPDGPQLARSLRRRDLVTRASGYLMGRDGVSEEEAYRRLVLRSRRDDVTLHRVAERLLVPRSRPGGGGAGTGTGTGTG